MAYDSLSINDYGFTLRVDCGTDTSLASATKLEIICEKPDGTTATYTGANSSNRYITYTFTSAPFSSAGTYLFRAKVTFASAVLYGDRFEIRFVG